ncbi:hypothetical protein AB1Y20_007693 [Prymnesium parvum]|uniref:Aldehyde-alcohol dehydrogenase n=1 Tax=Prymnesium parvum TaxID=97485 RepID=A0AB34IYP2_PRYPA|mmetsp:Transcript_29662/g.62148  ORF Transcript_29662/g.62148 Transcript_29662/m.62148 type:complete len:875 (+) Transcript_29662:96-2720(+)
MAELDKYIDDIMAKAKKAEAEFACYTQEQVDLIFQKIAHEADKQRVPMAKLAAEETGMGLMEDKIIKNACACELIYDAYKNMKTVGVIDRDPTKGIVKIATPVGTVCCITPVTNPTATAIAKTLFLAKTRNVGVFLPHPRAMKATALAVRILHDAGVAAGAPQNFVQCITPQPDGKALAQKVMTHPSTNILLATGGPAMVKASYSTGHPAIGVGPGNAPVLVDETADLKEAVGSIVLGKSFDNGMICASEQSVVCVDAVYAEFKKGLEQRGVFFVEGADKTKLEKILIVDGRVNPDIVGQSALKIAQMIGVSVPKTTVVLAAEETGVGEEFPMSHEKLSPVLALYKADDFASAKTLCRALIQYEGIGHTAGIYSRVPARIEEYAALIPAGRILVNVPTSLGAIGSAFNFNIAPSFTLATGTQAGSSLSTNVTPEHLLNIKLIATRQDHIEWFHNPPRIFFNRNCLDDGLQECGVIDAATGKRCNRALIVSDKVINQLGHVRRVQDNLEKQGFSVSVFDDVNPDPDMATVRRGVAACRAFKPDLMICIGGGSPMDAGKFIRASYEHPELQLEDAAARFVELRKRTCPFPRLGTLIKKLVCIPTTSGTASEVTPFSVITDDEGRKHPLFSYRLTPDVAIIDSSFCDLLPKSLIANAGVDAITHATEAYVSVAANEFTETHCLGAVKLLFANLRESYHEGTPASREAVHKGATLAGLAFSNSFLGINHSLSHKIGAAFHLPHGLTNAVLMAYVIRYNAVDNPTRMGIYPGYAYPAAKERYASLARHLGLKGETEMDLVEAYIGEIDSLMTSLRLPKTFAEAGIKEEAFLQQVDDIALNAFDDQCTIANPRMPLVSELKEVLLEAYYGQGKVPPAASA